MSLASRPIIQFTTPAEPSDHHPGAFRFQPRGPRFRNLMRNHPSDALATPLRSIARHPYPSIRPAIPVSVLRYPYLLPSGSLLPSFAIRNRGFSKMAAERGAS